MNLLRPLASLAAVSAVFAVACSSGSSGSSVSNDQAATDVAKAFCQKFDSCASLFVTVSYGDEATCEARFKLSVTPSLTANGTGATTAQYESCAKDIPGASCDDLLSRNFPTSCRTVAGSLADGTACGVDSQCKGKLCRLSDNSSCGACSTIGAGGATCSNDNECDYGLTCVNKVCSQYGQAGGTCDTTHPCKPTLACTNGTCATPGAAGAACPGLGMGGCDNLSGLFCDQAKVCAAVKFAAAGAACGYDVGTDTYTGCSGGGTCKLATGKTTGTCTAPAADGAQCDTVNGPSCMAPAVCSGGVCKVPDPSTCK